jgi:hypothetical protein
MSDPATASATQPNPPDADKPTRSGRLLALVRKLIDYAAELAATIRQRVAADPTFATIRFGTNDITQILACITRGLLRANALEARVLQHATALDKEPRPPRLTSPRTERKPPSARTPDPADALLARLPTPEQIAAEVRRRPIGVVLADICRDLGILPSHPLWRELQLAIVTHGGAFARLVIDILNRTCGPLRQLAHIPAPGLAPPLQVPSGTGPP